MGVFGDKLRREREMRGITLGEISESTKISKRWLQALENEEFNLLPGGVFNRGFVRSYARFLGLDEDQAVADYVAASNEQPPAEDKFPLEIHEKEDSPPLNPRRSFVPVLLAIVALVFVVGGWTWWVKHKPQPATHASQPPQLSKPQQSSSASASAPGVGSPSSPSSTSAVQEASPTNTASAQPSTAAASSSEVGDSNKPQSPPAELEKKTKSFSGPNENLTKSFIVFIKAKEDSWISIVADGKTQWEGTLDANAERSIQAARELVVRTGNAGGLDISYNGKPLGALGKEKQVRTFTFNTAGLQQ
jgi:cytoskeleton protein RodZ